MSEIDNRMVTTDKYIILDSRMVLMEQSETMLYFPIIASGVPIGKIALSFENDDDESRFVTEQQDKTLVVHCYNVQNALGLGSEEAMLLGFLNGKEIKLLVWIAQVSKNVRKVEYTLYQEK